jgi:EAL domain-containing protein (putative c-di-GMP-specific phosphodiesterase class I)
VLNKACSQLSEWKNNIHCKNLTLSINVSAKQLIRSDFVTQVQDSLNRYEVDPTKLKLELTESMLINDFDLIVTNMLALSAIGVSFSLDDFGTGYSSLQYLKKLPLSQLKIDQSFVRDIVEDNSDYAISRTIIMMANSLGLTVIAEGVETEQQRQCLMNIGCVYFQGYLFGKPMPLLEFETLIKIH